jgi:hypothetical protein
MQYSGGKNVLNTALTILVAWLPMGWAEVHADSTLSGYGEDCAIIAGIMIGFFVVVGAIFGIYMASDDRIKKCRHQQLDTSQPEHPA